MMRFIITIFFIIIYFANGAHFPNPSVTQVTPPVELAESPHWVPEKNILYYIDILQGGILAYHYDTQNVTRVNVNGQVTPVVPARNIPDVLYVGIERDLVAIKWNGTGNIQKQKILNTVNNDWTYARFNDGKADKQGRLWWGTMDRDATDNHKGHLYKITKNTVKTMLSGISSSNGLAWNRANDKLYYIDTPTLKIVEFDYDEASGNLSSTCRIVFDVAAHSDKLSGSPDGMTIDVDDNLFIALYGGGVVVKVDSKNGEILQIIPIPAKHVTCAAFGGPDMSTLFVSTSNLNLTPEERIFYPAAGSIFAVQNLGTKGLPANKAVILEAF